MPVYYITVITGVEANPAFEERFQGKRPIDRFQVLTDEYDNVTLYEIDSYGERRHIACQMFSVAHEKV